MGNSASNDAFLEDPLDKFDGIDTLGYRVLGVQPGSPAAKAGLVSFLDFIVGANEKMLLATDEGLEEGDEYDDVDFPALLREFQDKELELLVYNLKTQEARLVTLIPSNGWGGAGLLGVTIRLDNYGGADERLVRVLDVQDKSPAAIAGLVPLQDYLLGTTVESFGTADDLADALHGNKDRVVEVYVYNTESDIVRVVSLFPTFSWGGGLLGAEVGTGYLHRLPASCRGTTGASQERKVRYVGVKNDDTLQETVGASAVTAGSKPRGRLEVEPQLEMEEGSDEFDSAPSSGRFKFATPQQVADHGQPQQKVEDQGQPQQQATNEATATSTASSSSSEPTKEQPKTSQQQAPAEAPAEKRNSAAEDFFAGPPPMSDVAETPMMPGATNFSTDPPSSGMFGGVGGGGMPPPPFSSQATT